MEVQHTLNGLEIRLKSFRHRLRFSGDKEVISESGFGNLVSLTFDTFQTSILLLLLLLLPPSN